MILSIMRITQSKYIIFVITCIILFFTATIRFYKLGSIPASLYIDEVAMLADVKSVLATGQDIHGNSWYQFMYPSYGDYKLPVYIWFATASSFFLGASEFSLRLVSAVAGVGTVIIAGLITRELLKIVSSKKSSHLSKIFPIATMLVVAISPWSVLFSRTAFEGHLAQLFVWSSVYFVLLSKRRWWFLILGILLGVLAVYTYYSVRFVWPVFFVLVCLLEVWYARKNKLRVSVHYLLKIFGGLAVFTLLLFPLRKSPYYDASQLIRLDADSIINVRNFGEIVIRSNTLIEESGGDILSKLFFHRYVLWLRELALNYSDHLSPDFLFFSGDSNLRHGTGRHGVFLFAMLPFLLLGIVDLLRKKPVLASILFLMIVVAFLPASIPETTPHALRSINALVPLSIVIGYGISILLIAVLRSGAHKKKLTVLLACLTLLLIVSMVDFLQYYFSIYPEKSKSAWFSCEKSLIDETKMISNDISILFFNAPDRMFLWSLAFENRSSSSSIDRDGEFGITRTGNKTFDATYDQIDPELEQTLIIRDSQLLTLPSTSSANIAKIQGYGDDCQFSRVDFGK